MFEGHLVAISRATAGTVPAAARIQAAETERWLHGQIDRLDRHSGVRGRLVGGARRVRQRLTRRRDWRPMPPDIAETLQPAGGPSR
jgi:hypothetical protein